MNTWRVRGSRGSRGSRDARERAAAIVTYLKVIYTDVEVCTLVNSQRDGGILISDDETVLHIVGVLFDDCGWPIPRAEDRRIDGKTPRRARAARRSRVRGIRISRYQLL